MATQIPSDKTAVASISAKDAAGNAATVESPSWASSDANVFTVEPTEDGMSCRVKPTGPAGSAQLQFSCDADIGEGVKELTGQADVEIVAGEAAVVEINLAVE